MVYGRRQTWTKTPVFTTSIYPILLNSIMDPVKKMHNRADSVSNLNVVADDTDTLCRYTTKKKGLITRKFVKWRHESRSSLHSNLQICVWPTSAYLTLSPPIPLRLYTLPYWSNPPFLIFNVRTLWRSLLSARASERKNGGLDQYGAEPFKQQRFKTSGVEGVNKLGVKMLCSSDR